MLNFINTERRLRRARWRKNVYMTQVAQQVKPISSKDIARISRINAEPEVKYINWHTAHIAVRTSLSMSEYVNVVHSIIHDCCQNDDADISIELIEFSMRANIIAAYAYIELPKDIDDIYRIMFCTDIFKTICSAINQDQLNDIRNSVMRLVG